MSAENDTEMLPLEVKSPEQRLQDLESAMNTMAQAVSQLGTHLQAQTQQLAQRTATTAAQQQQQQDDSNPYSWLETRSYKATTALGVELVAMSAKPPPLKGITEMIKDIPVYEGVPEVPRQVQGEDAALLHCQRKLAALMHSLIDGYESDLSHDIHNKKAMSLARSAFQDLLEIRRANVARYQRKALEQRPDAERVELFSTKEKEEMEKMRARSRSRGAPQERARSSSPFRGRGGGRGNRGGGRGGFGRGRGVSPHGGGRGQRGRGGGRFSQQ